jgi:hypothetical protein
MAVTYRVSDILPSINMYQYCVVLLLIAIPVVNLEEGVCKSTDNWQNVTTCYEIFKELSRALTSDKRNLYRMQHAFFYAPNADPALIKVKYKLAMKIILLKIWLNIAKMWTVHQ